MKRNIRNVKKDVHTTQKGITLIALVITIIALLILAGVVINYAVDANGLFNRANEAKTEWNNRVAEEGSSIKDMLAQLDMMEKGWDTSKIGSVVTETSKLNEKDEKEVAKERTAPIPTGFTASQIDSEKTIAGGLVIYEDGADEEGKKPVSAANNNHATALTTRNQYVWIPVDDINDMIMCSKNGKEEGTNAEGETTKVCHIVLQNGNLVCEVHNNSSELVGRLYTSSSSNNGDGTYSYPMTFSETTKESQTYTAGSSNHEPNTVSSDASNSVTIAQLQTDFYAMAKSVYTYGGFYIARYEAGIDGASKKNQDILTAATSGGTNYLAGNMWYGLYNTLRKAGTTTTPNSHMIWGSQYDQVIKFIGSEAQTGHGDGRVTTTQSKSGNSDDILKNIYDLEGNCYEWTAEADGTSTRTSRGGNYGPASSSTFFPASGRYGSFDPTNTGSFLSSRAALYL